MFWMEIYVKYTLTYSYLYVYIYLKYSRYIALATFYEKQKKKERIYRYPSINGDYMKNFISQYGARSTHIHMCTDISHTH